jgi:hypothetical protein
MAAVPSSPKGGPELQKSGAVPTIVGPAVHSFSPDVTPEDKARFDKFVAESQRNLAIALKKDVVGKDVLPFASERQGEVVYVSFPLTVQRGDLLGELISVLASKIPTCVVTFGSTGWVEPEWTAEQNRRLLGMVSALHGPPTSFATGTSPVDLTRTALWISACSTALSKPGGVRDAQGACLPTEFGGAKSAAKYLERGWSTLRSGSSDEKASAALKTLEVLMKMWLRGQEEVALSLVRKQKIAWGTVVSAGAPTKQVKVKGRVVTQIQSPLKPSRSPWISGKERAHLSSYYHDEWSKAEELRKKWTELTPEAQHSEFNQFVKDLKAHYEQMNGTSSSAHAKLGHRKRWIYDACKEAGVEPKSKKDKTNQFTWSQNFFKLDLDKLPLGVALIFAPNHYLKDSAEEKVLDTLWTTGRKLVTSDIVLDETPTPSQLLWRDWIERFSPDLSQKKTDVKSAEALRDDNPYSVLFDTASSGGG